MGKTQKPLTILVTDSRLYDSEEVQALKAKGHTIEWIGIDMGDACAKYDVIIGPQCWRIIPTMGKLSTYLDLMLAGVRNVKYPKVP